MKVNVLFFGILKDFFEADHDVVELTDGATVADLVAVLRDGGEPDPKLWSSIAVAVNQDYVDAAHPLHDADEVALLPPVSGGKSGGCDVD